MYRTAHFEKRGPVEEAEAKAFGDAATNDELTSAKSQGFKARNPRRGLGLGLPNGKGLVDDIGARREEAARGDD